MNFYWQKYTGNHGLLVYEANWPEFNFDGTQYPEELDLSSIDATWGRIQFQHLDEHWSAIYANEYGDEFIVDVEGEPLHITVCRKQQFLDIMACLKNKTLELLPGPNE